MKIRDLLAAESIELNGKVTGKKETLDAMVDLMAKSGKINDVEVYRKGVYAREEESTTGIGEGIAIPHCKSDSVSRPGLAAMVVPEGVDFDSLDGEKVNLIFLIAAPNTKENVHLDVLSKLSVLLMDEDFTANLRNAKTVDEFLHVIDAAEAEKDAEEEKKEEVKENRLVRMAKELVYEKYSNRAVSGHIKHKYGDTGQLRIYTESCNFHICCQFFIMISYDADQRNSIWSSLEIGLLKSYVILYYRNCHIGKY